MISIVIPNYNSKELLRQNLPGVLDAAQREDSEVIVVDDASSDGSVGLLRCEFPSVHVVVNRHNVGFGGACMAGARVAKGDILVLLNTDVDVDPGFLAPLRADLEDEGVFAVSAVDLLSGTPEAPREVRHPSFRGGFFCFHRHRPCGGPPYETLFVPGGYAAYRKVAFMELGGFDPLYEPYYWEDVDICYRAWKRGWRSVVEPRSHVHHEHDHGSIAATQGPTKARAVDRRNRFLFLWKNVTSGRMLVLRHILPATLRVLFGWARMDFEYYLTLVGALGRLRAALRSRREESVLEGLTDEAVFARTAPRVKNKV